MHNSIVLLITAPLNNIRYRQLNVRRLLPASDYCRALFRCLNCAQRFDYRALGVSRMLGGAADHFIDGSEKTPLNFRVGMLLKGAVNRLFGDIFVAASVVVCLSSVIVPNHNRPID